MKATTSGAYYNEHDPFAAAWLRELIKAGLIAPGEVDERDIQSVTPSDLRGFTQCHFFAGIGVWSYALRLAGWPDSRPVFSGSCPCQPFSASGKRQGGSDDRHLWPHWARLIRECKPPTILGEQVEAAVGHGWIDLVSDDLEKAGYAVGAVSFPACSVGAPHQRQRLYFVAHANDAGREPIAGHVARAASAGNRPEGRSRGAGEHSNAGLVADTADARPARGEIAGAGCGDAGTLRGRREQLERGGATGELGDTEHAGHGGPHGNAAEPGSHGTQGRLPHGAGAVEQLENADGLQPEQPARERARPGEANSGGPCGQPPGPGATNGFWRDALWLPCRDGKWRPVERATESMLAALPPGLAAELGLVRYGDSIIFSPLVEKGRQRVGRLRGYGNSIVAPQAAEFIKAYLETTEELT